MNKLTQRTPILSLKTVFIFFGLVLINLSAQARPYGSQHQIAENDPAEVASRQGHLGQQRLQNDKQPKQHLDGHKQNKHLKRQDKHDRKHHKKSHKRSYKHANKSKHNRHGQRHYKKSQKARHHYHGSNYCEEDHYETYNYYSGHHKPQRQHWDRRANWREAGSFRTKKRKETTRVVAIHDHVAGIELVATKRSTYIHRAYVEFSNGNTRRIRNLEGEVSWGEPLSHYFRNQRHVVAVHLEVSKAGRKRGYVQVNYTQH